jgi:tetratricopeptide (TPR) repeat protein
LTAAVAAACMLGMWLGVLRAVLYGMVVLSLAGAAFLAGVITARETAEPPPVEIAEEIPAEDRAAARALFEEALAARFAGRHREALARLEEARAFHPSMRGLEYQFALTSLDLGEFGPAEDHARRSVDRDEETGNAQALLGLILLEKSRRDGTVATQGGEILARLQASRETDPLNPMPLYVMGEYYRSAGTPELAVDAYRRALERVSKTDSYLVTTVKAGLAGLRLNHRDGDPPLKLQEINGVLPPEQLFFGAADALLRGDNTAAARFLDGARQRIPDEVFQALLQDSFFQDYLDRGILSDPLKQAPQP